MQDNIKFELPSMLAASAYSYENRADLIGWSGESGGEFMSRLNTPKAGAGRD